MVKCGPPSKMKELEGIHKGCIEAGKNRKISPATKQILALLARQTKMALEHGRKDYDKKAFLQEVEDIEAIHSYMNKRSADGEKLGKYEHFSHIDDYATALCGQLKEAKGASFKNMFWIQIVEKLDEESAGRRQWEDSGVGEEPKMPMHKELVRAMTKCQEHDFEQGFWEIRLYACRNGLMHSGILDKRLCGKYDDVLDQIRDDMRSLNTRLPEIELGDAPKYRKMIQRFRSKWFEFDTVDEHDQPIWKPNKEAREHQGKLAKGPRIYDQSENSVGQLHVSILELIKELKEIKEAIKSNEKMASSTRRVALASLDVVANAVPKPNEAQKRVLEEQEIYTPETKRRRMAKRREKTRLH